jgi:hypothetical protein
VIIYRRRSDFLSPRVFLQVEFNKAAVSLAEQMPNNTTKKAIMNRLLKVRRHDSCNGPHLHHGSCGPGRCSFAIAFCGLAAAGRLLASLLCALNASKWVPAQGSLQKFEKLGTGQDGCTCK